ncbi:MAG TPA: HesA/MoeB/ThiF family protein [Flavobacteriales bacterium]|jgi:molybdopterin/thiamine biosynthesis adenylyltransferase/rhodanese-related sulfurtransferase|nr:HesA/MoeB/ThiF family protein [Flavobacteriales bacterium]
MRYARQIALPNVGRDGQQKLRAAKVLMVGAGGLGCPALQYLAAAGVGTLGIVDGDHVELSNLHRQTLFTAGDIGRNKAEVAVERLHALNPDVKLVPYPEHLDGHNAARIAAGYDVVIDGTDDPMARYLINDLCVQLGIPFVHGSIHRFAGQVSVLNYQGGPTYRCLFPDQPAAGEFPDCAQAGVLGVLPGIIGTVQASEALKIILGIGTTLSGKLKVIDPLQWEERTIAFARNEEQVIKARASDLHTFMPEQNCDTGSSIDAAQLMEWLAEGQRIHLLDVRELHEEPAMDVPSVLRIPLGQLLGRLDELPAEGTLVVICQHGIRSKRAMDLLNKAGLPLRILNLEGGMAAFASSKHIA